MPRGLSIDLINYLKGRKIKTAFMVEVQFQDGWVYLTTHARDVLFNGITYLRAASLAVEGVAQNLSLQNSEAQVSLSGIPQSYKALVFNQEYIGNEMIIKQGFFDFETDALVGDLIQIHKGPINGMQFIDDPESGTASISLPVSSIFARFNDKNSMMTNPSTHKKLFPSDTIFDQVPQLVDKIIEFGKL